MEIIKNYVSNLTQQLADFDWNIVEQLAGNLLNMRFDGKTLYICGNGGSAGNAIHLANDFSYGINPGEKALKVEALSANPAVLTCLGNDIGYENIYSHQLLTKGEVGDILIVLSGSGNSANIVKALEMAKSIGMTSYAIVGYSGGKAKDLADHALHFPIDDMQISEDTQVIVGHMLMQILHAQLTKQD